MSEQEGEVGAAGRSQGSAHMLTQTSDCEAQSLGQGTP